MSNASKKINLRSLPDTPGVYFFYGKNKKIIYIGRATSLRARVRSYFDGRILETRGPWIHKMVSEIASIDFEKADSVLEAILLEAELIKRCQPKYNTDEKDDKSANRIVITKEKYPRVLLARKNDVDTKIIGGQTVKILRVFGPFPHSIEMKSALKIIRRIIPWRDTKCVPCDVQTRAGKNSCRPCFSREVGLCPGVCTGEISAEDYSENIRLLILLLSGKKKSVLKDIESAMKKAGEDERFEDAIRLKKSYLGLKHIHDVALIKRSVSEYSSLNEKIFRIEAYDLSHFGGKEIVGAMTVVENGRAIPSEYRLFKIRGTATQNEPAGYFELLSRRLKHAEWRFPDLIAVDGNDVQRGAAIRAVADAGLSISIVAVTKDEKHRQAEIIPALSEYLNKRSELYLANSEAHRFVLKFQRKRRHLF